MSQIFPIVVFASLPASGKSEVRKFLKWLEKTLGAAEFQRLFHLGPTVQLDDFPVVDFMRKFDEFLSQLALGRRVYYRGLDQPFQDPRDWGMLIHMLNWYYRTVRDGTLSAYGQGHAAEFLVHQMNTARRRVGAPPAISDMEIPRGLFPLLEYKARGILDDLELAVRQGLCGNTVVMEFARGGPDGAKMPLPAPLGYGYSCSQLDPAILEQAVICYIDVTPEQSRAKNAARADPNDPGSILHHSVPIDVMMGDYGCDDMEHMAMASGETDMVMVTHANGQAYRVPCVRLNNRGADRTSFVRKPEEEWQDGEVKDLRGLLEHSFDVLWRAHQRRCESP